MNSKLLVAFTFVLCGIAIGYKADQLPVLPMPQFYSVGTQAREVSTDLDLHIQDKTGRCGADCIAFLKEGFTRVIKDSFTAQQGLHRWQLSIHPEMDFVPPAAATAGLSVITELDVELIGNNKSEVKPTVGTWDTDDEWYTLTVNTAGSIVLRAKTVYGVIRAFETLAQLNEWDDATGKFTIARLPLAIDDKPRFKWRGIMLDVARHFYPIAKLEKFIDTASSMKMNVIHLHLSDAQSFAFEIESIPTHQKAAFGKKASYSHADIKNLIQYADKRGVMIVPEIDIPAHTASWRYFDEDVATNCWEYLSSHGSYMENQVALNPSSDKVWDTIKTVLSEVASTFNSPYTHVGGDEVVNKCWETSTQLSRIQAWMKNNNITDFSGIERYFNLFTQKTAEETKKRPIVWEDTFVNGNMYNKNAIVHVWRNTERLVKAVKAGHDVIQSYGFYTDRQSPICSGVCANIYWMFSWTFHDFYDMDPTKGLGLTEAEEKHVLGGEAAQWSESTDPVNVDAMALSRTVAIAERLWSPSSLNDYSALESRSQKYRCLAVRRGISQAGPLSSDYCELRD